MNSIEVVIGKGSFKLSLNGKDQTRLVSLEGKASALFKCPCGNEHEVIAGNSKKCEINGTSVLYALDSKKIGKEVLYAASSVAGYTNVIEAERMRRKSTWTRVPEPAFTKQRMYEEFGSGTYRIQDTALR